MQEVWHRYLQLKRFFNLSWSAQALQKLGQLSVIDPRLGSPSFECLWQIDKRQKGPRDLLVLVLELLNFSELTGEIAQTQSILSNIYPDLSPDSFFWREIAELVDQAFPGDSLSQKEKFARQIHQLRYVISSHQAEYVRQHFRRGKMTDAESLAKYLSNRSYDLTESARLHNKLAFRGGKVHFPDGKLSYNIKILQHFHTEFILNSSGRFLNELDPEMVTEAGIINGASFNYASQNNERHWELDVSPVNHHDPDFRRRARTDFRAPDIFEYRKFRGDFARFGRSCLFWVRREARIFSKMITK